MSSFFTVPAAQKKRKRATTADVPKKRVATSKSAASKPGRGAGLANGTKTNSKRRAERDESISGGDDDESDSKDEEFRDASSDDDGSSSEGETAAAKRLRLAQQYLEKTKQEVDEVGFDAADIDRDLIAERLQEDVAEAQGKVYRRLANKLNIAHAQRTQFGWNSGTNTGVAVCAPYAYFSTSDGQLLKYRIQDLPQNQLNQTTRKKPKKQAPPKRKPDKVLYRKMDKNKQNDKSFVGHTGGLLAVRASQDGKFVVTGGADKKVVVWNAETLEPVKSFQMHRDAVTGLAFRRGTNQLYSCSRDRTVKVFSLDELAYVETLYGHQDCITDIDALGAERCVSVGARDRTARWWKLSEETQLVFRGGGPADKKEKPPLGTHPFSLAHEGSMDRVAMIDDELFVTGSDNGSISLWSIQKKKPLFVLPRAHGIDPRMDPAEISAEKEPDPDKVPHPQPRWITALRTIPYSDVVLSGSWDGQVRMWKLSEDKRKLEPVGALGSWVLGQHAYQPRGNDSAPQQTNGISSKPVDFNGQDLQEAQPIKGIVNDIAVFERGERGKDGLCVVVATGREIRLGRWKVIKGAKCGGFVFEIPRFPEKEKEAGDLTNGVHGDEESDDE